MGELSKNLFTTVCITRHFSGVMSCYRTNEVVFDWAADNARIAARCSDPDEMGGTVGFAQTLNEEKKGKTEAAVYVIAPDGYPDICKIGVSTNPIRRLADLQGSHWAPLRLHGLLWSPTRKAETVEQRSLEAASEAGNRLMGEWVRMEPSAALTLIIEKARLHKIPMCDSKTWVSNWRLRMESLHRARLDGYYRPPPKPLYAA